MSAASPGATAQTEPREARGMSGAGPESVGGPRQKSTMARGVRRSSTQHYAFVGREVNHKCAKREEMGA